MNGGGADSGSLAGMAMNGRTGRIGPDGASPVRTPARFVDLLTFDRFE